MLQLPRLVFLRDDQPLLLNMQAGSLILETTSGPVTFDGHYATSIVNLISHCATDSDRQRISFIEKRYPQLSGIGEFTNSANMKQLLLGSGLGMLFVELTARCNEQCIHCYAESAPEREETLSIDEIKGSLAQARQLGRPFVQFTGGDPLIHPHLVEAVACASSLDFAGIEIYTNGVLLNRKLLAELSPFQPDLAFSLYSNEPDIHDAVTRLPGSFEKTIEAIRRSRAAGLTARIGVVVMPQNQERLVNIRDFIVDDLGIDESRIRFDPLNKTGRGEAIDFDNTIAFSAAHLPQRERIPNRTGKLCIAYDGTLYPCIFSRDNPLGNIRDGSIVEILDQTDRRLLPASSATRWQSCLDRLSCSDCRMIAYTLGE